MEHPLINDTKIKIMILNLFIILGQLLGFINV